MRRLLAAATLPWLFATVPAAAEPALGLIVRLKDAQPHTQAPAHTQTARRLAAAAESTAQAAAAQQTRRVLREASLRDDARPRAVGRDLQWLDFGRELPADEAQALAKQLAAHPAVDWVEPNVREKRLSMPTDPLAGQQWWLRAAGGNNQSAHDRQRGNPGFLSAWTSGLPGATGRPSAVVAVLDTGITPHPDLDGRLLPGYDFVSEVLFSGDGDGRDDDPSDPGDWVSADDRNDPRYAHCAEQPSSWHGTVIAGMLAAGTNNGIGVAAMSHDGRVLPVRVAGKCGATVVDIIDGMRWAAGLRVNGVPLNPHPARIVNVSFGGNDVCGNAYQSAADELRAAGVVIVAAAGNDHGHVARPANCRGVVGVMPLNRDGFKAHYANFGPALSDSGVATVGGDDSGGGAWGALLGDTGLVSVWNDGRQGPGQAGYAALYGSSFAAPVVSGTLALMLSVNPELSAAQLVDGLRRSARPHVTSPHIGVCSSSNPGRCLCTTSTCGAGIVDAAQALAYAANPQAYVAPARQAEVLDHADLQAAAALGPDRPPNAGGGGGGGGGGSSGGGGGGGAASPLWWAALLLAALALRRRPAAGW